MAFSHLDKEGMYNNDKSYFVNNATNEDIEVVWAIKEPQARGSGKYLIKSGEKGGPYPEFLAYHIVRALVSREMQRDGKIQFMGSAEFRAPYEEKYLQDAPEGSEDALSARIREEERAKLLAQMQITPIAEGSITSSETRRKAGRPRKEEKEEYAEANQ